MKLSKKFTSYEKISLPIICQEMLLLSYSPQRRNFSIKNYSISTIPLQCQPLACTVDIDQELNVKYVTPRAVTEKGKDTITPDDLISFQWQIACGMVRFLQAKGSLRIRMYFQFFLQLGNAHCISF